MQGLGPFVINEITNEGAVQLEMLDNKPMGTFINGSRLKHFHETLIDAMLEHMHAAKNRKLAPQQLKVDAQAEAREKFIKSQGEKNCKFPWCDCSQMKMRSTLNHCLCQLV